MTTSTRLARSPSLRLDDNHDPFSSPDPLAISINDENYVAKSSPVKGPPPSPRKRRITQVLQDITTFSPQKPGTRSVQPSRSPTYFQSEQSLSPWKIRVTVEAEPEDGGYDRVKSTSKTTMMPLRDISSPTKEPRRRRTRDSSSRKSDSRAKAGGTPIRNGRRNTGANKSRLTDIDTSFLDGEEGMQTKPKRKPGTRKSEKASEMDDIFADQDTLTCIAKQGKDIEGLQLSSHKEGEGSASETGVEPEAFQSQAQESPKLRELDFNRISVRGRGGPSKTPRLPIAEMDSGDNQKPVLAALAAAKSSAALDYGKRQVSAASAITYPTPDASVQDEMEEALGPASDPTEEHGGFDTILESEGFTMIDLDSLPSARHFITSPGNSQQQQTEPSENSKRRADLEKPRSVSYPVLAPPTSLKPPSPPTSVSTPNKPPPTPIPSYLAPPEEGESDLSSTVPSSPPVELGPPTNPRRTHPLARSPLRQAHTPLAPDQSWPKLPSPPTQPPKGQSLVTADHTISTPPRLARVVRAGIALQGLLSPKTRAPSLESSPMPKITETCKRSASTPKERLDNLFVGFDSGTRRELRAGLRFGEELAKKQRVSSPEPSTSDQGAALMPMRRAREKNETAWRGETVVKHTPMRCKELQGVEAASLGDKDIPASQNTPTAPISATPSDTNLICGSIRFLDAEARECRWQKEREAISRQIENANVSQVIVIDSDSEDESDEAAEPRASASQPSPAKSAMSEAEEDIWLAQAEEAHYSSQHTEEGLFPPAEQLRQRERAKEVISKPRRSLIPSPWMRGKDVDSTFMTNDDMSGMFWQPKKSKEGTSSLRPLLFDVELREASIQNSDVDKMVSGSLAQEDKISPTREVLRCQSVEDSTEHGADEQSFSQNGPEDLDLESHLADEQYPESDAHLESCFGKAEETYEESSIPPQAIMVPVNFNDTTELSARSEDPVQANTQLESPTSSPCHPVTPRSAMKGSRARLNVVNEPASPTPQKVAFSKHSLCLDDSGFETSMQVRGDTLSPKPSTASDDFNCPPVAEPTKTASVSWFSRLTGWGSKPAPAACTAPVPKEAHQQQPKQSSEPSHRDSDNQWPPTTTALTSAIVTAFNVRCESSQFLAHASDPRIPPPPETMSASGYFSDYHYKHLHILWLKSLKPTFTRPGSIRPALKKYIGKKCYSGDGEFAWEVTELDAEVVERWIRSFEGRGPKEIVRDWIDGEGRYRKIGWDEWDLCMRLFSIVVGQEFRREDSERKEK
jgi:hypothetical protein